MSRVKRRRLLFEQWPTEDRMRWERAIATGDVFDGGGPAAHLSDCTRRHLIYEYECFLGLLSCRQPILLQQSVLQRVSRDTVAQYVDLLRRSSCESSVAIELGMLRYALRVLYEEHDWLWLLAIVKRIATKAKREPRARRHRLVTSEQLYVLGKELMERASLAAPSPGRPSKQQAFDYRDGFLIALLALIPLRRRTVAALEIGIHLVNIGSCWSLEIPGEDTKTHCPLEYSLSSKISAQIDEYLTRFRHLIPGANTHNGLWPSNKLRPMDHGAIYDMVRKRTRAALGYPVNLHAFRHAAATLWSIEDPVNVRGIKDLLGQSRVGGVSETHYIKGQSRVAARLLRKVVDIRRELTSGS